jgi:phosphate-selective porin OprO/OprP
MASTFQLRRLLLGGAAVSVLALSGGQAFAADADVQALQAKVDTLTAEVETLKAAIQAQAQASAQNQAQSQVIGQPRASQNATGQFILPGAPATAPSAEVAEPRITQNSAHRFALTSADGEYSIGLTGDIQIDAGAYSFHPDSSVVGPQAPSNGVNARRARIGVTGTAPGGWGFALVYDAGNSQDTTPKGIETAQLVYGGIKGVAIEAGYSNTFFTLDQSTSSNDTLFLERSSASNVATNFNTGDARTNAGVRLFGDRYWVGGYVTGPASGDSHTLTAERFGSFQRVAVQALKGPDYTLHLGVGVDELLQAPNSGYGTANTLTLSDQPELRIDPTTLLSTGTIGTLANPVTKAYVLDFETAATWRNLFWQGEYYAYQVDRRGLAASNFNGAYGQVSWTITGESHL